MHRMKTGFLSILTVAMILYGCASDEEKKLAHFEKGKAYFEKGDYKAAIIEFKNATQIDPKYKEVYSHLGQAYLKAGDLRGAFRAYAILAELDPDNTEAQLNLSRFLMLGRQFAESREKIDAILNKEPDNIEALLMLAGLLGREENLFEAVIGLPPNLFYGTGIPAAIIIFNKGKKHEDVLFIDASREFQAGKNQNKLRMKDIEKIVKTYQDFETLEKYAYRATLDEIKENDFNLNIPRYVDTFEEEEEIDIPAVQKEIEGLEKELADVRKEMEGYLKELGF